MWSDTPEGRIAAAVITRIRELEKAGRPSDHWDYADFEEFLRTFILRECMLYAQMATKQARDAMKNATVPIEADQWKMILTLEKMCKEIIG